MASGGNLLLAGTGITPKANTDRALWGIMRPEGPCCFQEPSAPERVAKMKTVLKDGYDIRAVQELLGHNGVKTPRIYTHVLHGGWGGVRSPADRLPGPAAHLALGMPADAPSRSP